MRKGKAILCSFLAAVAILAGGYFSFVLEGQHTALLSSSSSELPEIEFYTSPSVTTPQLAFWKAEREGELGQIARFKVNFWKDLDQLKTLVVAGQGDLWLGHLEGFALARRYGSPVKIIAVTGWKKFYLLSKDPSIATISDLKGEIPYTPPGSPILLFAQALLKGQGATVTFEPAEVKQLSLILASGRRTTAIVPEPAVSALLKQVEGLRVVSNIEEEYGRMFQKPTRLPLAGIAVNMKTTGTNKELVEKLISTLVQNSEELNGNPASAGEIVPKEFTAAVPADILRESLKRDLILVKPARDVRDEIEDYLSFVLPRDGQSQGEELESLIW